MNLKNNLVPHFRVDLYTKTMLVYQKRDTKSTLVSTNVEWISLFWDIYQIIYPPSFYPSNKDIFNLYIYILIGYQIFTFFNLTRISMFLDICRLFIISWISKIQKNASQLCWVPIFCLGQKIQNATSFKKKEYFVTNIIFSKNIHKKFIN
jgi:hypothetical protein